MHRKQGKRIDWNELADQMGYPSPEAMAEDLYIKQGLGAYQISQEVEDWLGLNWRPSPPAVLKWLHGLGYKTDRDSRYKGEVVAQAYGFKDCRSMLISHRENGKSWEGIGHELEIPKNTIANWRKRVGL